MILHEPDEFMFAAIDEAKKGLAEGGIPVGSVLVRDKTIIGRGHNQRVQKNNPILHAEIDCLQNAGRIGSYKNTVLYSTLMPCYLCAGAVVQFGIPTVVVGESITFKGAQALLKDHWVSVIDFEMEECIQLMEDFIKKNPALWNEDIGK
jgi:cytosine deaminase